MNKRVLRDCNTFTSEELARYIERISLRKKNRWITSRGNMKVNIPTGLVTCSANLRYSFVRDSAERLMHESQICVQVSEMQQENLLVSISGGDLPERLSFSLSLSKVKSELSSVNSLIGPTTTLLCDTATASLDSTHWTTELTKCILMVVRLALSPPSKPLLERSQTIFD